MRFLLSFLLLLLLCGGILGDPPPAWPPPSYVIERQWQNIMDYGAKGDGTTDDRAAIQAALDAVPDSGGCVFVPHSDSGFLIDTTLIIKSYTTLLGVGRGSKILLDPALDTPFIMIKNTHWDGSSPADTGIVIDGIYWDMGRDYTTYDETTTWNQSATINFRYAHKCIVQNCFVTRSHKIGIVFQHTQDSKILNNVLWEIGQEAIAVATPIGRRNIVSGNHCIMRDTSYTGIEGEWIAGVLPAAMLLSGGNTTVSDNIFRYGGGGIDMFQQVDTLLPIDTTSTMIISNNQFVDNVLHNCISPQRGYNLIISGNVFRNCNAHGIYMTGPGEWEHGQPGPDSIPHDIIITGNQFLDHHKLGIWAEGGHGYTITTNVFSNLDTTAIICGGDRSVISGNRITQVASGYGIYVKAQRNSIIANNQVSYVDKSGIYFDLFSTAHEYLSITGNSVRDCGDYGIDVLSLGFSTLSNNVCVGNALGGIHLSNSDYNVVSDNVCRNSPDSTQAYGILLESNSNKNIIHSNMLGGNVTAAISGGSENAEYGNSVDTTVAGSFIIHGAYAFPNADGSAGYVLATDGSGALSWQPNTGAAQTDTFYVAESTLTVTGWKHTGDTIFIDTSGGGAGSVDSFYVIFTDSASAANGNKHVSGYLTPNDTLYVDTTDDSDSYWAFRDSTTIVYVNDSTGDTILFLQDTTGFQGLRVSGVILDTLTVNNYMMVGFIYGDEVASYKIRIWDSVVFCSPHVRPSYNPNQTYDPDSVFITLNQVEKIAGDSGGAGGEANTIQDTGVYNDTEGFGLSGGKAGVDLHVKGLIEGSNITITASGDSAYTITSSGSAAWVASNDTFFLVDADDDTLAAFWDDDAGNVRWQVATEDQSLKVVADTLYTSGILIVGTDDDAINDITGTRISVGGNALNVDLTGALINLTSEVTGELPDANVADNITVDEASDADTSGTKLSAALATRLDDLLGDLYKYFDRTYFDTLIDASGDSIICVYSDSTDLSIFDTDDLSEGASNKYDQALPDSSEWSEAYDSSQVGYLNPADANVDSAHWNAAWLWGDHSGIPATIDDTVDNWFQNKLASNNTETRITVTYQSVDSTIDFVVDDMNDDEPEAADYGNLTGGHGITHDPTGTIKIDTADAVADAETKPVTGNAVFDFCETTKNYALNSELHTRSHAMTSTSDHTAGNYKLFHSDGSGEVQELAHGASSKVLTSGGASSAPTWATPPAAWNWQDSAGEPPFWVDSAKYAATAGGVDPFIPGKLTVTGPIERYNFKLELDTTNIYCPHADTFLRLPIDTSEIGDANDTFQLMHPSICYIPDPEGKFGYKYWLAGTPPQGLGENVHILVSNDEVTWTEFVSGSDTLYNPVFDATSFDSCDNLSDPDILWNENGDLFLVFRVQRTENGNTTFYLYCASTSDGIDWSDTTLMINGYYNDGTDISPDSQSLAMFSPGVIMRGAGDYFMYTTEDTGAVPYTRAAWVAPRIDTLWDNAPGFDSTFLFGTTPLVSDTIRASLVRQTYPSPQYVFHADEIVYGSDLIVSLGSIVGTGSQYFIYMGLSVDGEYFNTVSTPLLDTTNDAGSWDHNTLYRVSGYFIVGDGEVLLVLYYSAKSDAGDWFTGRTYVHFGDVLHTKEALIWNPDLITDTVPIFEVDSVDYPGGIQIHSLAVQTSEDGTYALKFFTYTAADPPVLHDYIDTLNVGADDQRVSSREVDFEDDDSSLLDRGQLMYMLTPADNIDWIKVKFNFYVRDWE